MADNFDLNFNFRPNKFDCGINFNFKIKNNFVPLISKQTNKPEQEFFSNKEYEKILKDFEEYFENLKTNFISESDFEDEYVSEFSEEDSEEGEI